ncbi:EamA family transporter [Psychrobacter sp. I-STPA10]|uniref:EamA family transporter n=1 Tax=Psychrobacter sp. I-STPA10 TaxID=2585769 RepID=UPI001E51E591|nr:EamA family transporter [Psychrobacter sp. I-STPA10]
MSNQKPPDLPKLKLPELSQSSPNVFSNLLLTALAPILWGTTYIVTTQFLPPDRPLMAAVIRVLPAGLLLTVFFRQLPQGRQWWQMLLLAFLNISCFQAMLFISAYRLPGGIAAVVGSLIPLIIMILMWAIDHIIPSRLTIIATLTSIIGMAMLLVTPAATWDLLGLMAAFMGAVSMGLGMYLSKRWQPTVSSMVFTGWQLLFGGLLLLPVAMWRETLPSHLSSDNILGYAYLAFFGSLIAYALFFRGIATLTPVAVSVLGIFSPITATIIGWLWLQQRLSPIQLIGLLLALASVVVVQISLQRTANK